MEQLVALCGQQTLLLTDVELVESHPACPCVQNAFKGATMMAMTSTCFGITNNTSTLTVVNYVNFSF